MYTLFFFIHFAHDRAKKRAIHATKFMATQKSAIFPHKMPTRTMALKLDGNLGKGMRM